MHILVSNDDGIFAPGLLALAQAMRAFGTVTVVAPEENQSANGHRKTLYRPLRVNQVKYPDGITAYSTDGSPADCVALAMLGVIKTPVDLVVSGINRGPNMGQDLTYSGTLAAAFEGTIQGVPSVAFSLNITTPEPHYDTAAHFAEKIVPHVIESGFTPLTLINVNVPDVPLAQVQGVQITRQGVRIYNDALLERQDPFQRPYYWIGGGVPGGDVTAVGTDIWAVHHNYVSITPIHLDMTATRLVERLQTWRF
jgi:5'-nucleotidase